MISFPETIGLIFYLVLVMILSFALGYIKRKEEE